MIPHWTSRFKWWFLRKLGFRYKVKDKVIYTYHSCGVVYFIHSRTPNIGQLATTWHLSKKKHLEETRGNINVFVFDENCAAHDDEYDFRVVTFKADNSIHE